MTSRTRPAAAEADIIAITEANTVAAEEAPEAQAAGAKPGKPPRGGKRGAAAKTGVTKPRKAPAKARRRLPEADTTQWP